MRYVYTGGPWREFRGYVFALGKPVSILDKATEAAIAREKDFKPYEEAEKEAPVLKRPVLTVKRK